MLEVEVRLFALGRARAGGGDTEGAAFVAALHE